MEPSFQIGTGGANGNGNRARRRSTRLIARRNSNVHQSSAGQNARRNSNGQQRLNENATNGNSSRNKRRNDGTANENANKRRKVAEKKDLSELQPSFAMMPVGYQPGRVLHTNYGEVEWTFNLGHRLTQIHEQHCPTHDLYVVGYRVEERPGIADLKSPETFPGDHGGERIAIPFFAVHALPQNYRQTYGDPQKIILEDNRKRETKTLLDLSLHWENVATLENGALVKLLTAASSRTDNDLPPAHVGGYVSFPQRPEWARNPGEAFELKVGNDTFPFCGDVWMYAKSGVKRFVTAYSESKEEKKEAWVTFMKTEDTNQWIEAVLPYAVDEFFQYYGLDRDKHLMEKVRQDLKPVFEKFREQLLSDNLRYNQFVEALGADQPKNFKIYPENSFLKNYLQKGDLNYISKWIPKNEQVDKNKQVVVYPPVEE